MDGIYDRYSALQKQKATRPLNTPGLRLFNNLLEAFTAQKARLVHDCALKHLFDFSVILFHFCCCKELNE